MIYPMHGNILTESRRSSLSTTDMHKLSRTFYWLPGNVISYSSMSHESDFSEQFQ